MGGCSKHVIIFILIYTLQYKLKKKIKQQQQKIQTIKPYLQSWQIFPLYADRYHTCSHYRSGWNIDCLVLGVTHEGIPYHDPHEMQYRWDWKAKMKNCRNMPVINTIMFRHLLHRAMSPCICIDSVCQVRPH